MLLTKASSYIASAVALTKMKKFLTKLSIYKTFASVNWSATRYAFTQWLYCSRPWKEAYNEYMSELAFNIARMHGAEE